MFQGEPALCYSCMADRAFGVLSVKYDWKQSVSLNDLRNLWSVSLVNTSSYLQNIALFRVAEYFIISAQYYTVQSH
jgi:hypothetical protein